jgi:hypothetical protein
LDDADSEPVNSRESNQTSPQYQAAGAVQTPGLLSDFAFDVNGQLGQAHAEFFEFLAVGFLALFQVADAADQGFLALAKLFQFAENLL